MGPTEETLRRTGAAQAVRQIADAAGSIGQPWLTQIGMLYRLEERGTISPAMVQAGERFAQLFYCASLDPLKAADMSRIPGVGRPRDLPSMVESAQRRVHAAMLSLGGHGSPAAELAWHCLGLGRSLQDWARREGWGGKPIRHESATLVLIDALAVLVVHLGMERRRPD